MTLWRRLIIENSYGLEIWKRVEGYEGLYEISTLGNVKSLNYHNTGKEKILKNMSDSNGYQVVGLCKDRKPKTQTIHRLVAKAWLPTPQLNQTDINHKDEVKSNNKVENLEWSTREFNNKYGTRTQRAAKAESKAVLQFDKSGRLIAEFPSITEAERQTGIANQSICYCCKGKRQFAGGFKWQYKKQTHS